MIPGEEVAAASDGGIGWVDLPCLPRNSRSLTPRKNTASRA